MVQQSVDRIRLSAPITGNNDAELTRRFFHVNPITLTDWIRKSKMRSRWFHLVKQLTFDVVLNNAVPSSYREYIRAVVKSPYPKLDLKSYAPRTSKKLNSIHFLHKSISDFSHQKEAVIAKKHADIFYVKKSTKRIFQEKHTKSHKYHVENEFIQRFSFERWNCGLAISKS